MKEAEGDKVTKVTGHSLVNKKGKSGPHQECGVAALD